MYPGEHYIIMKIKRLWVHTAAYESHKYNIGTEI